MASIRELRDQDGNVIYPVTHISAVFNSDGNNMLEDLELTASNVLMSDGQSVESVINDMLDKLDTLREQGITTVNNIINKL